MSAQSQPAKSEFLRCKKCSAVISIPELEGNLYVCPRCGNYYEMDSLKRIEICGSKGQVILEEDSITKWEFVEEKPEDEEIRKRFAENTSFGGANDPKNISQIGHTREFADFAHAIKTGTQPYIPGEEARRSVHLIRSIYESARTGAPVKL